jgi:hypothetical protein
LKQGEAETDSPSLSSDTENLFSPDYPRFDDPELAVTEKDIQAAVRELAVQFPR